MLLFAGRGCLSLVWRIVQGFGPWGDVWLRSGFRVQVCCEDRRARLLDPSGAKAWQGAEAECVGLAARLAPRTGRRRVAVLLHGILNGRSIMQPMAAALEQAGWGWPMSAIPARDATWRHMRRRPALRRGHCVTVAETRLPEAETVFLLIRALHNGLVQHRRSVSATICFLETGRLGV